jgi:hypothetical protein
VYERRLNTLSLSAVAQSHMTQDQVIWLAHLMDPQKGY